MTPVLMAVCLLAGIGVGWMAKRHRLGLLAENNHWVGEEIEALKGADLDADVAAERALRLSGQQPAVEPAEVEQYDQDTDDSQPRWESEVGFRMHVSRGWNEDPFAPGCGCDLAPCGLVVARAGCVQHDNSKTIRQAHPTDECPAFQPVQLIGPDQLDELRTEANAIDLNRWVDGISADSTVEHLGQACGWSEDGETDCGDPAEGWTRWPDGTVVWLCAGHFQWVRQDAEDDGPETLPRVLPEGRVSD